MIRRWLRRKSPVRRSRVAPHAEWLDREGVGAHIDITKPFQLVNQHPVTTEYGSAAAQIEDMRACRKLIQQQRLEGGHDISAKFRPVLVVKPGKGIVR